MMMYLDEVVARLEAGDFPYSNANAKKIRGSARKCQKLSAYNCPLSMIRKRRLRPTWDQLDGLKFQGRSSSIWPCGWPAAMASRVALR